MSNHNFPVGTKVRSYDFRPMSDRGDCYVEGTVVDNNGDRLMIAVDRDVFGGLESYGRVGLTVATPIEMSITEFEGRIVRIG